VSAATTIIRRSERAPGEAPLDLSEQESLESLPKKSYEEGRRHLVTHKGIEGARNPQLVKEAKKYFKRKHGGMLSCQVCTINFFEVYGDQGADFIEAHHRVPIAQVKGKTKLRVDDLAMVCANCHRMLHRRPWISVEKLRKEFEARKAAAKWLANRQRRT
jgi:predicted HNH restriction endonuclease